MLVGTHEYVTIDDPLGSIKRCLTGSILSVLQEMPLEVQAAPLEKHHIQMVQPGNLFIGAPDADVLAMIKYWWFRFHRLPENRWRIPSVVMTSDAELLRVELARLSFNRDEEVDMTLDSRIADAHLAVIRLGHTTSKKAAGVIEQEINLRANRRKPLWVIDSEIRPFAPGAPSFSEGTRTLLGRMARVGAPLAAPKPRKTPSESEETPSPVFAPEAPVLVAKFGGRCALCAGLIAVGQPFKWADKAKNRAHVECPERT